MQPEFNALWALLMFLIVLAAVPALIWLMRRLPGTWRPSGKGTLEIRESLNLGPRERILVLRSGERHLLVGATAQSIQLLTELHDYPDPGRTGSDSATGPGNDNFARQLEDANDGLRR